LIKWLSWQERFAHYVLPAFKNKFRHITPPQAVACGLSIAAHLGAAIIFQYGGIKKTPNLPQSNSSIRIPVIKVEAIRFPKAESLQDRLRNELVGDKKIQRPLLSPNNKVFPFSIQKLSSHYYFSSKELSDKPLVLKDIPADLGELFPEVISQTVGVWLFINEAGLIDQVRLENSGLPEYANFLLRESLKQLKFYPGKIDGLAVKSKLKIEVLIEPGKTVQPSSNRSIIQ
jgi:hypothetical protein